MSTRHLILTFASGLICAATLHAGDAVAAKTEPTKAEPPAEPYQLKNRSSFSCPGDDARAPFWPIGWVHRKGAGAVALAAVPKAALEEKNFRVTSILLGTGATGSLAVINGRAYSEGEFLKMPRGTAAAAAAAGKPPTPPGARIRVQRIGDGTVVLQREEQTVTLILQRPELAQKKAEESLLDEDR
jgi:hypothetical protein